MKRVVVAAILLLALGFPASVAAAPPSWNLTGVYTVSFTCTSSGCVDTYIHTMTITASDDITGAVVGTGVVVDYPGSDYAVTGTVSGSDVTLHIVFSSSALEMYNPLELTGVIDSSGTMSGTAVDEQGRTFSWETTAGKAAPIQTPPTETGSITFLKVISGDVKGPANVDDFVLTFGTIGTTNDHQVVSDLPFGDWQTGEDLSNGPANYTWVSTLCEPISSVAWTDAPTNIAHLSSDFPNWTCTTTNEYTPPANPATVYVEKNVYGGTLDPMDVYLTLDNGLAGGNYTHQPDTVIDTAHPGPDGYKCDSTSDERCAYWTATVTPGAYWFTESVIAGYTVGDMSCMGNGLTQNADSSYTFAAGQTYFCAVDNHANTAPPTTGTLKLVKVVIGGPAVPGDFTLTYVGPTVFTTGTAKSGVVKTLPFSTYTVGEQSLANYTLTSIACVPNGTDATPVSKPVLNVDRPDWTCTLTNTYSAPPPDTYCITMSKTDPNGNPLAATFTLTEPANPDWQTVTFTTNGTDPGSVGRWCDLSAGTYVFTETTPPSGYTGAAPQTVTLPVDNSTGNASLTFIDTPIVVLPSPLVSTTCGGTVTFTGFSAAAGWQLIIDTTNVGIMPSSGAFGPLSEAVGVHTYKLADDAGGILTSGTFTIGACYVPPPVTIVAATPTATPTASPSASPVATPTPTPTSSGGVLGATSTPSLPPTTGIPGQGGSPNGTMLLLLGALGAASLALITTALLRVRLLGRVDR